MNSPPIGRAVEGLSLRCHTIQSRFEGEADLFPAGDRYIFTFGGIEHQRFVPRLGWPPWRRIYGFRSEPASLNEIEAIHPLGRDVLRIRLVDERYYHGDTCLCSFGPKRELLLAYPPVIEPASLAKLRSAFGDQLIEIGDEDAAIYAANSFAFIRGGTPFLVMPEGITSPLQRGGNRSWSRDPLSRRLRVSQERRRLRQVHDWRSWRDLGLSKA